MHSVISNWSGKFGGCTCHEKKPHSLLCKLVMADWIYFSVSKGFCEQLKYFNYITVHESTDLVCCSVTMLYLFSDYAFKKTLHYTPIISTENKLFLSCSEKFSSYFISTKWIIVTGETIITHHAQLQEL